MAVMSVLLVLAAVTTITCSASYAAKNEEIAVPTIRAGSYVVMSGSTSEVVHNVYGERKMPMGNITKYMTAMVVIDNMYDDNAYNHMVTIGENADSYGDMFNQGDMTSVESMLYAMLVGGSDEAAEALVTYSATNRETFINEMNAKVMELGLMNTQYHNPTGRYHTDHYSTALDSAKIVQAAMRYPKIADIMMTDSYAVPIQNKAGDRTITVTNTNPLLSSNKTNELYKYTSGGILGEVEEPGKANLVAQYAGTASRDGMQLIVVLLSEREKSAAMDAKKLFRYGYKKVTKNTIIKAGKQVGKARVKGGAVTRVDAYTETKGYAYIPPEGSTDLVQTQVVMYDDLEAPLKAGDKVGEYRIYVADELKGTVNLVTQKDVPEGWLLSRIYISNVAGVIICVLLVLIILFVIRVINVRRRRAKRREQRRQELIREAARKQMELDEDRRRRNWTYK